MVEQLWRDFRAAPAWVQVAAWVVGFWILIPFLIGRSNWHCGTKTVLTVVFLLVVVQVGAAVPDQDPPGASSPTVAQQDEPVEDETPDPSQEIAPSPTPASSSKAPPVRSRPGLPARVTRVIDGDTVEAAYRGQNVDVRLIGIDTPETVHPSQPVGCLGKEASAFTTRQLSGARVRLELDVERTDRYGRLLAYVWVGDELFNEQIVSKGFAKVSTYPPNVKYEDRFLRAQRQARSNNRGLWAPDACPEPAPPPQPVGGSGNNCDANYKGTCVPVVGYDLDCADISGSVQVVGEDIHGLDAEGDGFGCESN